MTPSGPSYMPPSITRVDMRTDQQALRPSPTSARARCRAHPRSPSSRASRIHLRDQVGGAAMLRRQKQAHEPLRARRKSSPSSRHHRFGAPRRRRPGGSGALISPVDPAPERGALVVGHAGLVAERHRTVLHGLHVDQLGPSSQSRHAFRARRSSAASGSAGCVGSRRGRSMQCFCEIASASRVGDACAPALRYAAAARSRRSRRSAPSPRPAVPSRSRPSRRRRRARLRM